MLIIIWLTNVSRWVGRTFPRTGQAFLRSDVSRSDVSAMVSSCGSTTRGSTIRRQWGNFGNTVNKILFLHNGETYLQH
ncbi:hypothetical protein GVN20_23310 [Runella sp. CRIBMP]|uniref:hypothetical protein n=1 Tax=Runella sp. CRIBMP TaxID=2683261 RepID=UPI00141342E0|nr:hypothetical protein [Runella sp. CRIBMP]NBB22303.1 hypothetical protein [Runella sp. CRIBMP]